MNAEDIFKTDILKVLRLDDASEEERKLFTEEVVRFILASVVRRVKETLTQEKRHEFEELFIGSSSDDARADFINENIPDFEKLIIEEIVFLKAAILNAADEERKNQSKAGGET